MYVVSDNTAASATPAKNNLRPMTCYLHHRSVRRADLQVRRDAGPEGPAYELRYHPRMRALPASLFALATLGVQVNKPLLLKPDAPEFTAPAPERSVVTFDTSKGNIV